MIKIAVMLTSLLQPEHICYNNKRFRRTLKFKHSKLLGFEPFNIFKNRFIISFKQFF